MQVIPSLATCLPVASGIPTAWSMAYEALTVTNWCRKAEDCQVALAGLACAVRKRALGAMTDLWSLGIECRARYAGDGEDAATQQYRDSRVRLRTEVQVQHRSRVSQLCGTHETNEHVSTKGRTGDAGRHGLEHGGVVDAVRQTPEAPDNVQPARQHARHLDAVTTDMCTGD